MTKIAIILHAEPGTHDALGRALHALLYAKELHEEGHNIQLIFDGGGTKWIEEFTKGHKLAPLYQSLKSAGVIAGVCDFCVPAFDGDKELVKRENLTLINEYNGHPSIAKLVAEDYQIITL
ncbi:MAG: DsrE family protein [SAR324 cluster bacterium]|nr:DsrE family protein [SAR324 cluster bacterium]